MKGLRGTAFDPFGRMGERKMERALIVQYEADLDAILAGPATAKAAMVALAELPLSIRGYGPVKAENEAKAMKQREELLAEIRAGGTSQPIAAE
jgi:indolepyruvate ferredoxin oxidoreductase